MCTRQDMEDKKIIETGEPVVLAGCLFLLMSNSWIFNQDFCRKNPGIEMLKMAGGQLLRVPHLYGYMQLLVFKMGSFCFKDQLNIYQKCAYYFIYLFFFI